MRDIAAYIADVGPKSKMPRPHFPDKRFGMFLLELHKLLLCLLLGAGCPSTHFGVRRGKDEGSLPGL
jgi:hypothetical protein